VKTELEIRMLAEKILQAKHLYYKGCPQLSDAEYDTLESRLSKLDPLHPVLAMVGAEDDTPSSGKIIHATPMLSLRKTYDTEELESWLEDKRVVATPKLDGNSLSLVYKKGKLSQAKTRGDGTKGEDVLSKVLFVPSVPNELGSDLDIEVRGELICSISQFAKLQSHMEKLGLEIPTNPRNTVAGILGRKSHGDLAVYFDFFAFDLLGALTDSVQSEEEKMQILSKSFVTPDFESLSSKSELGSYLDRTQTLLETSEWAMDGAVFTYNNLQSHRELGENAHHPRYKMVFKWQGESAATVIQAIDWRTSRAGILTPVAIVEPVDLSGAKISNVTLHNFAFAKNIHAAPGDKVKIVRSGEVIPKYLETLEKGAGSFAAPTTCSACGGGLELRDEVRIYCKNTSVCPAQIIGSILHWIVQVNIDDLSEKRLEQLLDAKLVSCPADLYRLKAEDLLTLPQTKEKLANKLIENIERSKKQMTLFDFLSGLGIQGGGKTSWKKITRVFNSLEKVRSLDVEKLIALDGFAEKSAQVLLDGLKDKNSWIEDLLKVGVVPPDMPLVAAGDEEAVGILAGKSFVITGTLSAPRKEIERKIEAAGGKPGKAVSKNTFALVCNDPESSSSKAKKARELGLPFWSESMLDEKLDGNISE